MSYKVKNLFEEDVYGNIVDRINHLTPESKALWGKMNVSQMLAHIYKAFKVPLSDKPMPRMLLGRLLGWAIKSKLYDEVPWKQGLPTSPQFVIRDERNFEVEKNKLLDIVRRFHEGGPSNVGKYPHPMFGTFTSEQWGRAMWKHLDHHLRQFGV